MSLFLKFSLFILIGFSPLCFGRQREFISKEDEAYPVVNFKIPIEVWRQAFQPTPVLKSPVTVVVPIHVDDNEDNDINFDQEEEISDATEPPVEINDAPVTQKPIVSSTPVAITQRPCIQNNTLQSTDSVNGTVIRFPCRCENGQCGCCSGAILERIKMKTCGNITFIAEDFAFDVRLSINNNTIVRQRVSASDPPPICINPRRVPFVRVCADINNIRIRNGNAYACLNINADIAGFIIYSASFRCFGLGSSGVQTGLKPKPVSSGPKPVNLFGSGNSNNGGGTIFETAGALLGVNRNPGAGGGLFGGAAGGPIDAIGDAIGGLFEGRNLN